MFYYQFYGNKYEEEQQCVVPGARHSIYIEIPPPMSVEECTLVLGMNEITEKVVRNLYFFCVCVKLAQN